MDPETMEDELLAPDRTENVPLRPRDAGNLLQSLHRPRLDVIQVGLLDSRDLLQLVEAHFLDYVLLEHETVVLVLNLIQ